MPNKKTPGMVSIEGCRLVDLPRIHDRRGNLSFVESGQHIPFDIQRVFYLYDVPGGETRAGHAHKRLEQLIIAMSGSFDLVLDDGLNRETVTLNRSNVGIYVPNLVWRELENFSTGAVCLVLASLFYDENDYYRNYKEFLKAANNR